MVGLCWGGPQLSQSSRSGEGKEHRFSSWAASLWADGVVQVCVVVNHYIVLGGSGFGLRHLSRGWGTGCLIGVNQTVHPCLNRHRGTESRWWVIVCKCVCHNCGHIYVFMVVSLMLQVWGALYKIKYVCSGLSGGYSWTIFTVVIKKVQYMVLSVVVNLLLQDWGALFYLKMNYFYGG